MFMHFRPAARLLLAGTAALALLGGCARIPEAMSGLDRPVQPFTPNDFDSASVHTRHIAASQERTCEAARRALLSQGYLVNTATSEVVAGRKYYQPQTDVHYEVEMRVVCAAEGTGGMRTSAFASALQDRYVIKKINNSASLGVGGVGSVSLPVSATDDTLVKVGSETIADEKFYDRFFKLFERYVPVLAGGAPIPPAMPQAAPTPAPAVVTPLQEREAVPRASLAPELNERLGAPGPQPGAAEAPQPLEAPTLPEASGVLTSGK